MAQTAPAQGKGSRSKWVVVLVVVILVVGAIAYYLLSSSAQPASVTVDMPNGVGSNTALNFQPSTIVVVIGVNNTVIWTNSDSVTHTVLTLSPPGTVNSGTIVAGSRFSRTFGTAGTYIYECSLHPGWMKGTVVVKTR